MIRETDCPREAIIGSYNTLIRYKEYVFFNGNIIVAFRDKTEK
tara:strand:+ start:482 stop:610 length:129 start_codon:yes stop_codon:yes gene_type:complete